MSITTSDMGHWPVLEVVPFRGLRYARHATGVGNQHQQPAKHGWNSSCLVNLPTQLLWMRLRFLPCMVHWSRLEVISFKELRNVKHVTNIKFHTQLYNNYHDALIKEDSHFGQR